MKKQLLFPLLVVLFAPSFGHAMCALIADSASPIRLKVTTKAIIGPSKLSGLRKQLEMRSLITREEKIDVSADSLIGGEYDTPTEFAAAVAQMNKSVHGTLVLQLLMRWSRDLAKVWQPLSAGEIFASLVNGKIIHFDFEEVGPEAGPSSLLYDLGNPSAEGRAGVRLLKPKRPATAIELVRRLGLTFFPAVGDHAPNFKSGVTWENEVMLARMFFLSAFGVATYLRPEVDARPGIESNVAGHLKNLGKVKSNMLEDESSCVLTPMISEFPKTPVTVRFFWHSKEKGPGIFFPSDREPADPKLKAMTVTVDGAVAGSLLRVPLHLANIFTQNLETYEELANTFLQQIDAFNFARNLGEIRGGIEPDFHNSPEMN